MKPEKMVIVFSIVIGLFVCLIDGCLDYFIFYEGTFWGLLISDVPPHEIYDRTIILLAFAAFGVTVSRMMSSRTEADRKLQESEERFRSLFENAPLGHQSLDANGDFVEVNEAWCELLGYTKGEVLGRNFSEFIHPDFREKFKENFPKFESMGYVLGIEFEMVKKDGSEIVVAFDGQIDRRGDGSFKQTHCVLSDVTERKRAEDALRKSEAKFKTAVEQSPEMLFINKRGKIVFANERCEEVMGYARGELASLDFDFRTVVAPECLEMVEANFRTHTDGGEVPPYECALITKNGKRIEAILSSSLIDYEGDTAILGVATDITQRKQAEEALRKSEARFADIAENALEWIWEVDTKGRFTYASPVVKELLGYQPDELLGKHFFDFFHPEDREELKKAAFEAFAQKLPLHEFVNRNVHKTGRTVLLSTSGVPVLDACGNLLGYRGADTDITERNQAEEALRESEERHRVLFESSRDAIMTLAPPSWEFTSGNPASVAMFGARDEAEFTSLPPWKLSPKHQPDGRLSADKAKEMIDTAMQEGSHFFQWTHKTVDSREFPADVLLTRVELAGHSLLQATVRDITERKQVEEVLAERNRKLLKAQEIANFGFIDWDCDTDEITMSEEVQRLYQADPEKIKTGQELLQHAVHPEDLARVRKGLESAARSKTKLNIDHRIQPPDGPVRWVNAQAELEVDVAGNPESLLGSVIDITERKQAEEILRESEQRFRDLAELLPQTVCEADLEGRLTFVNRNALEMFGYSQEDLEAGLSTLDVLAPEERERARRNMERTLRGEDSAGNEYVAQRRDGSRFAVVVYSAPIVRQDRPAGLRAIIVDITDRRRSEDALRESEASNRAILDAIPDMMFRLSRDGTHLDFHAADPKQLYVQPKHILGKTVSDLLPADVAGRYMEHIRRTFANQATQFFEYQLEYPEKEVRYFEARMVPCDDDSVLAIVRDVTERRRAEEEIEHLARFPSENPSPVLRVGEDGVVLYANAAAEPLLSERGSASAEAVPTEWNELTSEALRTRSNGEIDVKHNERIIWFVLVPVVEAGYVNWYGRDVTERRHAEEQVIRQERLRALGEMASGIGHDLNNTLTPILGYSEMLRQEPGLSETAREHLKWIETGARDAAAVVARVRQFHHQEHAIEEHGPVQVRELLTDVVELTRPKWRDEAQRTARDIEWDLQLEDVPPVLGHPAELREVFTNLIFNAVDALPKGGRITLRLRGTSEAVVIEVVDTGIGMPADVRKKCLEPFFSTKGHGGTGLGLSVCHGIVERHGGRIEIDSTPGHGTTFGIYFPVAVECQSDEPHQPETPLPRGRVLYMDDDPRVRLVVGAMLNQLGQEVDMAESGAEGLEMFQANEYDVVVTDLGMPNMDGSMVASIVKTARPEQPVIMLTGWGSGPENQRLSEAPDFVLSKPVTLRELREALERVLRIP